jgi:hypothetical protein
MDQSTVKYVSDCDACQLAEKNFKHPQTVRTPTPWPKQPWQQLQLDIFGPLPDPVPQTSRFLLVTYDLHSKWPEVACMSSVTSTAVIDALAAWFSRWGLPEVVTTDGGPQFISEEFEAFLKVCNISHRQTPHYHPQGNAAVERFNREC